MAPGARPSPPPGLRVWEHHLWGRQLFRVLGVQHLRHQHVPKDAAEVAGHGGLLLQPAVVLEGQDDGVWGQLLGGGQTAAQDHSSLPHQDLGYTQWLPHFRTGRWRWGSEEPTLGETESVGQRSGWGPQEGVDCLGS